MVKNIKKKTLNGFTLVEMVIVLIIAGIIIGGVMKGRDAMESAKVVATIEEIKNLQAAVLSYRSDYGYLPGDDSTAKANFGDKVSDGKGTGKIDKTLAWKHMKAAGLITDESPRSSIGGKYTLINGPLGKAGNYLMLSSNDEGGGAITPKQAQKIISKARDGGNMIQVHEGKLTDSGGESSDKKDAEKSATKGCYSKENQLNLANNLKACVILVPIH